MKLPVKVCESKDSGSHYILDSHSCYVCGDMRKETADYIVQAINSHRKMRTALKVISDHEDLRRKAGIGYDSVVDEYSKQALKTEKL